MSSSESLKQGQENSLDNLGVIVAEERFGHTTTGVETTGNFTSSLLQASTRPDNDFKLTNGEDDSSGYNFDFDSRHVDPRRRRAKLDAEISILDQNIELDFDFFVNSALNYQPFDQPSSVSRKLSWKADENRVKKEFEGFKNELEEELLKTERERYRTAGKALEELRELEDGFDPGELPEISSADSKAIQNVLQTAKEYEPLETFEDVYQVENPGRVEQGNELVSNMLELEYLRENPEDVLREDLSQGGFSNRAELVLRGAAPGESEEIVDKAIEETEEIKSVYKDCWGNMMAVYEDNSRAKLVDSQIIDSEEDENSEVLGKIMAGAKEEFTDNEYMENMIDEVIAGGYSTKVQDWFTTQYLPENVDKIDDVRGMAKANMLVFGNIKNELEKGEKVSPDLDLSYLDNFSEEQLPWHYDNDSDSNEGIENEGNGFRGYTEAVKSKLSSYLRL